MKRILATSLFLLSASLVAGAEQLIPAGSDIQCIVSEKVSSKVEHLGDPVLCQVGHSEMYGRSVFPYGAYLEGRFEEYKDPGHFVGKGWMELKFDRMVVGNDTVIPISTRVVADSGKYPVDGEGRIHGTGHPTRDTIEWLIPVLWPIDLINLPRRGPTPVLKPETRLTVKVLDDFGIPTKSEVQHQPEMINRYNYADQASTQQAAPVERAYPQPVQQTYAPPQSYMPQSYVPQSYAQPTPTVVVVQAQAPAPMIVQPAPVVRPVYYYPPPVYAYPPPPPAYAYYRPY